MRPTRVTTRRHSATRTASVPPIRRYFAVTVLESGEVRSDGGRGVWSGLRHRDDDLAFGPAGIDVVQGGDGVGEVEDAIEDGTDRGGVDESADLAQLGPVGA